MKTINNIIKSNVDFCKKKNIVLPTFSQMKNPEILPEKIKKKLKTVGLWDIDAINLFRITWKNLLGKEKVFGNVNYIEIPKEISGVNARIIALIGKYFPTGAHKVGATFGCIAPSIIRGEFDIKKDKAVWPSTGNYCRGGAFVSTLLGCESIAILPEEMSKERFLWLSKVAGEVIATPGCESNVKEIFDKCWELKKVRKNIKIFNQFDEFGNYLWHFSVTGNAFEELINENKKYNISGFVLSSGSAGTLGSSDYIKTKFKNIKTAVAEALQCPTLLYNGFGGHRIEGIGDKHVPWIHNIKNTDMIIAVDDEVTIRLLRLFNEKIGQSYLMKNGVNEDIIKRLDLAGISSIGNLIASIKYAKYFELTEKDIVFTVFTDSMELYSSRLKELEEERGKYIEEDAVKDYEMLKNIKIDNMIELNYYEKKRIHNLKYFTWIEQQMKNLKELNNQWYDNENYWRNIQKEIEIIEEEIIEFNRRVGL